MTRVYVLTRALLVVAMTLACCYVRVNANEETAFKTTITGKGSEGDLMMPRKLLQTSVSPSQFCQDLNPRRAIQAPNVKFHDDCSSFIPIKKTAMTSPCALWKEAMTGSSVQTTYNLTIAFTTPPMSMKIVVDDGPADTSITRTTGTWSVEEIKDTDDGDERSNTGSSLFDFEDETTHSDVFTAFFRDPTLDQNKPIKVICH